MLVVLCSMALCILSCGGAQNNNVTEDTNADKYADALALIESGKYTDAYEALKALGDYKDAQKLLAGFRYVPTSVVVESKGEVFNAEFFYDADNMPLRVEITTNEGKHHSSEYTYDANGNLITKSATLMGEQFYTYEYTYDAHGNITKNVYTDMDGVVKTRGTEFKLVYTSKDVTERIAKVLEFDYL